MKIFIPCGGDQKRWQGPGVKELASVWGEPLLLRTIRYVKNRGFDDITLITDKPEIKEGVRDCQITWPKYHGSLCESLYSTFDLACTERTVVLLGDVVYSGYLLDKIFRCTEDVKLFGLDFELFALSFSKGISDKVATHFFKVSEFADRKECRGKLWDWYRSYIGLDFVGDYVHDWGKNPIVEKHIEDWSQDFDRYDIYLQFKEQMKC